MALLKLVYIGLLLALISVLFDDWYSINTTNERGLTPVELTLILIEIISCIIIIII